MAEVTMSLEEYLALQEAAGTFPKGATRRARSLGLDVKRRAKVKKSRKASAYSKRYGAAFKRLAKKNKKKNGGWKQGGFARTQKAAHRAAKK